jgi:WD40 repeat protein
MLALLATVILSTNWLPQFPDPPALLTRIGSPAFRYAFGGTLRGVSPDGKKLYTGKSWGCSGGTGLTDIFVWDALTGKLLKAYHPPSISRYYFASDGLRAIVYVREEGFTSGKYCFQLLDPDTGRVIRQGKPWNEPPTKALGFSDILHFVSEMTTDTWDVHNTGKELALLNAETGKLVSFNPAVPMEGASISVASNGQMALVSVEKQFRLYDLPEAKLRKEWVDTDQRQTVGFSADGKSLVVWKRLKAGWSLEVEELNGQTRAILEGQREPGSVKFAPTGKAFILRDWELRDAATGKLLGTVPTSSEQESQAIFSPDGRTLWTQVGEGTLVPWDVATGQLAANAPGPPGQVMRMRFAAEDKLVGLSGGFAITWDPTTGKEASRVRVPRSINWQIGATFTPAGDRLVYADGEGQMVSWNFRSGAETRVPLPPQAKPDSEFDRVLTPEGRFVISRRGETLCFHNTTDGKKALEHPVPDLKGVVEWLGEYSAFFDVSADGRRLAVVGRAWGPRSAAIIDLTNPKLADVTVDLEHVVRSIAMSPDARFFAAAGEDSVEKETPIVLLTVWNAATGRKVAELPLPSETAWALSFSPDGRTLAAVADEKVILVDTATRKVKASLRGRTRIDSFWLCSRNMLAWSPSGRLLAVHTADERLAIWDMTKLEGK